MTDLSPHQLPAAMLSPFHESSRLLLALSGWSVITHVFQMRKLKLKEVKWLSIPVSPGQWSAEPGFESWLLVSHLPLHDTFVCWAW